MKVVNYFDLVPEIQLVPNYSKIRGVQIIRPEGEDIMSAHKVCMEAWAQYPPHTHPSPHIIVIVKGNGGGKCGTGDREQSLLLKEGDVFDIPANEPHQVWAGSCGMAMLVFGLEANGIYDPGRMTVLAEYPAK
jgi:quercetin dioxygenase-like cupin family protein